MIYRATLQADVFICLETGERFVDDGGNKYSRDMRQQIAAGIPPLPYVPPDYTESRRLAYMHMCAGPDFVEAVMEFLCEGRREKLDAFQASRLQVKQLYPKKT